MLCIILSLVSACTVGPNYVRPSVVVPTKYKEADPGWKIAQPHDHCDRGEWWKIFNDEQLDKLETLLNTSNQNIIAAKANYEQARALVDVARAAYFPTVGSALGVSRQKQSASAARTTRITSTTGQSTTATGANYLTSYSFLLNSTWVPDLWGSVRRSVEASVDSAQASKAQLALVRLTQQAALAQFYFELRALDDDQKWLDALVVANKKLLQITKNRTASGVDDLANVLQARSLLETAEAAAINNKVNRAQFEHAIAVLIGQPPATFSITPKPLTAKPPLIPAELPATLLERRPDVAQSERLAAAANAEIGIATAAYFPNLTLAGSGTFQNNTFAHLFALPNLSWTANALLAETLFDGGLRRANVRAARANYDSAVANYRQTVLAAFQEVEDNLSAQKILHDESIVLHKALADAKLALKLVNNQYAAGIAQFSDVLNAQMLEYTAQKNVADVDALRMTTAVTLIMALGGGWDVGEIK